MKTKDKQQAQEQAQEYLKLTKSVFPNCLWRFVENYDGVCRGLEIAPQPGVMLTLKWHIEDKYNIIIEVNITYNNDSYYKRIFSGSIPTDSNYDWDFDFIKKILGNYKLFSQ